MPEILEYMESIFKETRWPFFSLIKLRAKFGEGTVQELDSLLKKEIVRRREGCNCVLVELT